MTAFVAALDRGPGFGEVAVAEVCELLLQRHAAEGALPGGEFYTPRGVADLLVDLADPRPGDRIMDPACGTGSVLAAAARYLAGRGPVGDNSFEAYAADRSNVRPAMLNLALHGVSVPQVELADPATLLRDRSLGRADRVLSNPPFNQRIDGWEHRQFIRHRSRAPTSPGCSLPGPSSRKGDRGGCDACAGGLGGRSGGADPP